MRMLPWSRVTAQCWAWGCCVAGEALKLAQTMRYSRAEGWILYERGLTQHDAGNQEVARQRLEEALAVFRRLNFRPLIERTEQALILVR